MHPMRRYLTIVCEAQVPHWYASGAPIVDVGERSPNAADILEPEEFDYDWRLCRVPVRDVRHAVLSPEARETDGRIEEIQAWFAEIGVEKALTEAPPLALILPTSGRLMLLDGYHRLSLAVEAGLDPVPLLVAVGANAETGEE
jgi:hypothetical protein